jgi:hypothetical protein
MPEPRTIGAQVTQELYDRVTEASKQLNVRPSAIVRDAVTEYLDKIAEAITPKEQAQ